MITLQASLLLNLPLTPTPSSSSSSSSLLKRIHFSRCATFTYSPLSLPNIYIPSSPSSRNFRFGPQTTSISCTLHPENANLNQDSDFVDSHLNSDGKESSLNEFSVEDLNSSSVSGVGKPESDELGGERLEIEAKSESGEVGLENGDAKSGEVVETEGKSGNLMGQKSWKGLPLVVFFMGLWATARRGFEKALASDWFSWWPFWRQEKRLERLIAEADANPKDPVKQSALFAELNKHRLGYRLRK